MAGEVFEDFGGIAPKIDPRRLAPNMAQVAQDCVLDGNALEPTRTMVATAVSVGSTNNSLYRYNDATWLSYSNDRDFARAPIANDSLDRIVITNPDAYPVVYSAGSTYRLGIPAPSTTLTATPTETPANPDDIDAETISYVVTFVDAWGAEGPPSVPSASIDRVRDTSVNLTSLPTAPVGNYNFGSGALKRIYRSNAGTAGANYQFVTEVAIATTSVTDSTANEDLGEILPSLTWIGPPDDDTAIYPDGPMLGITALPNGVLAGFAGKTLVFSEPYLYHAYPLDYRISFDEPIVAIAAISSGLLVVTDTKPYVVTGISPAAMAVTNLDAKQACVSKRGMVDMGRYAIYPSPDGLVLVEGQNVVLVTDQLFTRKQWQDNYYPTTIHAYEWEGRYIAFYNDAAGFIFDPRGGANSFVEIGDYLEAAYFDPTEDTLYVNDAGTVRAWGQGATFNSYTWKSRKALLPKPVNFGFIRVVAHNSLASSNVTVRIWADGDLKITAVLNNDDSPWHPLPGGFRAKEWEIEITGTNPISHIGLFESLSEAV